MVSNMEIINQGMSCLLEGLGALGTEQFISVILREKFDYTKWQQQKFDDMSSKYKMRTSMYCPFASCMNNE